MSTWSEFTVARIKAALNDAERSQRWLARKLNVTDMWLHRRLSGDVRLQLDDVYLIAPILGVSPAYLLPDQDAVRSVWEQFELISA